MEINELQRAKWLHFFNVLDLNGDGELEAKDFSLLAEKIYIVYESNEKPIGLKVLLKRSNRLFNRLLFEMHLMDQDSITPENWVEWLKTNLSMGEESRVFRRITYQIFKELFDVCDQNNDGYLSKQELSDLYNIFGIEEQEAHLAFQYIDENNDGVINRAEFLDGIREYFSDDSKTDTVLGEIKL